MSEELKSDIRILQEKLGAVSASATKAHARVDDLAKDMKEDLKEISADVKSLLADMNKIKGGKAAWAAIGGLSVALIGLVVKLLNH